MNPWIIAGIGAAIGSEITQVVYKTHQFIEEKDSPYIKIGAPEIAFVLLPYPLDRVWARAYNFWSDAQSFGEMM